MVDLSRRQVLQAGAAGASALMLRGGWPGAAAAEQPLPGPGAGDLKLWYDKPAGTTWLRALPVGNGRLGAMVFGNVEAETLQLNEDTVWAGGPYDSANPAGAAALGEIRRLVFENRWAEAQRLVDQAMLGRPVGQLAYQPVGNLRLAFPGLGAASEYRRELDLDTAAASVEFVAGGTRYRREVIASAVDQVIARAAHRDKPGALTFTAKFDSPQRTTTASSDADDDRARRRLGRHGGREGLGAVPGAGPRDRRGRDRLERRRHAVRHGCRRRHAADLDRLELRRLPEHGRRLPGHRLEHVRRRRAQAATTRSGRGTSRTTSGCSAGPRSTSAARRPPS